MSEHLSKVLNMLKDAADDAVIEGNTLRIPSKDLTVEVSVERADESENGCMAVLYFWLYHHSFEEPLFETAATLGHTLDQALENAVKSFYAGIFTAAIDYLSGDFEATYETDFFGEKKQWHVVASDLVLMGAADKRDSYWELINEGLNNHIGNKQLYYIKVFTSKQTDGSMICECRVNDNASAELAALLQDYVQSWETESFHSQKQFFFISQKTASTPYSYSKEQIEDFTSKAVGIFADCDSDEKYETLTDDIAKITGDYNLAVELRSFLPEMCAENHFDEANYTEYITLYKSGDEELRVYKDRFTPYNWIRNSLINGFVEGVFPEKAYGTMITMSATYNAIQQMQEKETDMSKGTISTGMYVPDDYKVR